MPFGKVVHEEGAEGSLLCFVMDVVVPLATTVVETHALVMEGEAHVNAMLVFWPCCCKALADILGHPTSACKLHNLGNPAPLVADEGS